MREPVELVLFIVELVLLVRLVLTGLVRQYSTFAAFVSFSTALTGTLWYVRSQNLYGWIYFCSFPVSWLLMSASGVEVLTRILGNHKGIQRIARKAMITGIGAGLLLSVWALAIRSTAKLHVEYLIGLRMELFLDSALILFWVTSTVFIMWFPLNLSRNIFRHCLIFTLLCAGQAAGDAATMFASDHWFVYAANASAFGWIGAFALWTVSLTRRGEDMKESVRHVPWDEQRRLLAELDAIDAHVRAAAAGASGSN